jgi:predicted nuclease with TOPRIM domain
MRNIFISLLILLAGLWGGYSLSQVDQELRVIYAEYTLATTDLGHINAKLIRYRTTVLRAIEADSENDFESIVSALPIRRSHIEQSIERFIKAANSAASKGSGTADELRELQAVKARLADYMTTSQQTIQLLRRRWKETSPAEAKRLRDAAEENAAESAGEKFIAVTLELDRLLEVVAMIAGEVRDDADRRLHLVSTIVVGISALLAGLVLFVGKNPVHRRN